MNDSGINPQVCFVCCHLAPANHFADMAEHMQQKGISSQFYASDAEYKIISARKSLSAIKIVPKDSSVAISKLSDIEAEVLALEVVKACSVAKVVITDLGCLFSQKAQRILSEKHPEIFRLAYYDNPENFVPGGYSEVAGKVILHVQGILFANANLAGGDLFSQAGVKIDLTSKQCIGLGFSSLPKEVKQVNELRKEKKEALRKSFLTGHGIEDRGQKLAVYFGGANEVYFNEAFPYFLKLLDQTKTEPIYEKVTIILQQHPRAISEGNRDGKLLVEWKDKIGSGGPDILVSKVSFNDAVNIADIALYYQTSANSKFLLCGIPTFQVGHHTYPDILVKNNFCVSAVKPDELNAALTSSVHSFQPVNEFELYRLLGIKNDWLSILLQTLGNSLKI